MPASGAGDAPPVGKASPRAKGSVATVVWVKRALVALAVVVVAYGVYRGRTVLAARQTRAPSYATATVSQGPVQVTVSDPGTVVAATTVNVTPQVGGRVAQVAVQVGQTVKAGDVLLRLEDDQGLAAAVASAQAALAQAQAQLAADLDPSLNVNPAQVQAAAIQVKQAQLAVQQQQDAVNRLTVTAPFAGEVTSVAVVPGQTVSAGQMLLTFVDNSQVWVTVPVPESWLPYVAVGGPATVTVQGTAQTYDGRITQIGTTPSPASKGTGQTFPVTVVLTNPGPGLMAGMTAIVTLPPGPAAPAGTQSLSATGSVAYPAAVTVNAQQGGTVVSVPTVGQTYAAGATLVQESNPDLQAQLQQAELTLQADQANLAALQSPAPPAQATVDAQRAQVASLQAQLQAKQQQYDQLTVRAPVDGQVTAVNVTPGETVGTGTTVVTLLDRNGLEAQVNVDELDVAKIKLGQQAQIQINALPNKTYDGRVIAIAPTAVVQNGVSTYQVTLSLPHAPEILPGMSLTATILVATVDNAVRVPSEAVQTAGNRSFVTVVDSSGRLRPPPVQVGLVSDRWTQIVSGLQPGQQIVVAFAQQGAGNVNAAFFRFAGGFGGGRPGGPEGGANRGSNGR
jgi:HlyD family secretion protein